MSAQGDIVIASGANTPIRLAKSTTSTQYLANTGTSNAPAWNEVALDTGISGTLPVGNGGTGATTLTANGALVGNGTSALTSVDMSTKGGLLAGDGSGNPSVLAVGGTNNHVLTVDSGETTGMKWGAVTSALSREGGQTTEATTTSTGGVDLLTASGLTIGATIPSEFSVGTRKTAGAADDAYWGLKLNSTVIWTGTTGSNFMHRGNSSNAAQSGMVEAKLLARASNYLWVITGTRTQRHSDGTDVSQGTPALLISSALENNIPNAEITSVIIRGQTNSASQTVGADELQVYSRTAA
jgi:hypothetical protein